MRARSTASLWGALLWFGASYGLAILGYLAANAIASRWLGTQEFGYFVVALTTSTVVGQLGLMGAHRGGLRDAARLREGDEDTLRDLQGSARAVTWVMLPVTGLLAGGVVLLQQGTASRGWLMAVGFVLLVWASGSQKLWANYLRGFGRVRFASLLEGRSGGALVACLQAVALAGVWWAFPGLGLAGALLALAAGYAVPVVVAGAVVRRHWRGRRPSRRLLADLVRTSQRHWKFAVNQLAVFASGSAEIWIAGLVLAAADASYFSAAQRTALLLAIIPTSLQVVFAPTAARMMDRGDRRALEGVLRTGATLSLLVSAVLIGPMLLLPGPLLALAFGEPFRPAALTLVLLTLAGLVNVVTGLSGTALTMSDHEGVAAAIQVASVVARLLLGLLAARFFGLEGLAVSAAVLSSAAWVASWAVARRRLGLRTEPTLRPRLGLLRRTAG